MLTRGKHASARCTGPGRRLRLRRAARTALLVVLASLGMPAVAEAQRTDSLVPESLTPPSRTVPPAGFRVSARDAERVADRVPAVRRERARHRDVRTGVAIPTYVGDGRRWEVGYSSGGDRLVEVHVDGRSGRVLEAWTGPQVDYVLARGYKPSVGRTLDSPYVWLPLCLLFVLPFVDPRRPLRLLHLDLLVMLAFGISQLYFNRGELSLSVPLAYPVLAYLLVRMLLAALRPRRQAGPLVPWLRSRWLAVGLAVLVAFRIGLNVADSTVIDVGYAGVVGADRITHGEPLYVENDVHGDSYGPVNYLAYLPFELVFPWHGAWDALPAAHAAALAFDLLTMLGLFLLGGRLRPGPAGRRFGLALAFAWAAYPYTLYVLQANTNDGLVAMLLVYALLAARSAAGRGAVLALGGAAKFVPLALAPLFATGADDRRPGSLLRFAAAFGAVLAVAVLAYLPDGGLRELYDATVGYQLARESPFSLWGLHPSLGWLEDAVKAGVAALALAVTFLPRRRDLRQVAALGAAVIIALQLGAAHWFYFYVVWFAPFALVAVLGAYGGPLGGEAPQPSSTARTDPVREPVAA